MKADQWRTPLREEEARRRANIAGTLYTLSPACSLCNLEAQAESRHPNANDSYLNPAIYFGKTLQPDSIVKNGRSGQHERFELNWLSFRQTSPTLLS